MNISYLPNSKDTSENVNIYFPVHSIATFFRQIVEAHYRLLTIDEVPVIYNYSLNRTELTFNRLINVVYNDRLLLSELKKDFSDEQLGFYEHDFYLIFFFLELSGVNASKTVSQLVLDCEERINLNELIQKYDEIIDISDVIDKADKAEELYEFLRVRRKKSTLNPVERFVTNVVKEIGFERFADLEFFLRSRGLTYKDIANKFIVKDSNQKSKAEDQARLLVTEWEFTAASVIGIAHSKEFINNADSLKDLHCARIDHNHHYTFTNFAMVYAKINQSDHKQAKNNDILSTICLRDMHRLIELHEALARDPSQINKYWPQ